MQSLKNKILEGFFANVGVDPFINWINEVFKIKTYKYCTRIYITSDKTAENDQYIYRYKVTKANDKSLLFNKFKEGREHRDQSIIINIPEIPELLNIKPNDVSIFCTDDKKNIKFLFGQRTDMKFEGDTYINNVLLTIDKKTGTIIDKEVVPKFLISTIPF